MQQLNRAFTTKIYLRNSQKPSWLTDFDANFEFRILNYRCFSAEIKKTKWKFQEKVKKNRKITEKKMREEKTSGGHPTSGWVTSILFYLY